MSQEAEFARFTTIENTPSPWRNHARKIALSTGRILTMEGEGHGTFLIIPGNSILTDLHCFEGRDEQGGSIHGKYLPRRLQLPNGEILEVTPETVERSVKAKPGLAELDIVIVQPEHLLSDLAFDLKAPRGPRSFEEGRKTALIAFSNDVVNHFGLSGPFVSFGFVISSEIISDKILSTSAPPSTGFYPGASGSPIINSLGEVIGIVTATESLTGAEKVRSGQIISHAVPTTRFLPLMV